MKLKHILTELTEDRQTDREARRKALQFYDVVYEMADKVSVMDFEAYEYAKETNDTARIVFDKNFNLIVGAGRDKGVLTIDRIYNNITFHFERYDRRFKDVRFYLKKRTEGKGGDHEYLGTVSNLSIINIYAIPRIIDMSKNSEHVYYVVGELWKYVKQSKDVIIHEYIHRLDSIRAAKDTPKFKFSSGNYYDKGEYETYFNTPEEFNAYYQEGVERLWREFKTYKRMGEGFIPAKLKKQYWDNPTAKPPELDFQTFLDWFVKPNREYGAGHPFGGGDEYRPFNTRFMKALNDRNRKRLYKRLYPEYKKLVSNGLWELGEDKLFATSEDLSDPYLDRRRF